MRANHFHCSLVLPNHYTRRSTVTFIVMGAHIAVALHVLSLQFLSLRTPLARCHPCLGVPGRPYLESIEVVERCRRGSSPACRPATADRSWFVILTFLVTGPGILLTSVAKIFVAQAGRVASVITD
jgi:hypothetical protein